MLLSCFEQNQELIIRYAELERNKGELGDKTAKLQNELENVAAQWEEADQKASLLSKQVGGLETQLSDNQELLAEETRLKLSVQSRLRQVEEKVESLQDQLEEEEEAKRNLESKLTIFSQQVIKSLNGHMIVSKQIIMKYVTVYVFLVQCS